MKEPHKHKIPMYFTMILDINNCRCHNAALYNPNSIFRGELQIAIAAEAPTRMFLIQVLPRRHLAKPIPSFRNSRNGRSNKKLLKKGMPLFTVRTAKILIRIWS